MKKIYILLTRSNTVFSRAIYAVTKGEYTHASIALDLNLTMLYSFGRKYQYIMLPAGFVTENVNKGIMGCSDTMKCALYELSITDVSYRKLVRRLRHMSANCDMYRYNILGIPACLFNIETERKRHFFCSQFVSYILKEAGAAKFAKSPSLIRPTDFSKLPEATEIFSGNMGQLRAIMRPE